jgi:hypothetical protein
MDVRVGCTFPDSLDQLLEVPSFNPDCWRCAKHIGCGKRPADCRRRWRARLSSNRPVAEIRAKKDDDRAIYGRSGEVDVRLQNRGFESIVR